MRPKKQILLVDDNAFDLSVMKFLLETNAYRVFETTEPEEALAIFCECQIDLVLTDHIMPKMDGFSLVARLKSIAAHIPMVVMGDPLKMCGFPHSADACLNKKTCSPQELLERVKIMAARKRGPRKGIRRVPVQLVPDLKGAVCS